MLNYYIITNN